MFNQIQWNQTWSDDAAKLYEDAPIEMNCFGHDGKQLPVIFFILLVFLLVTVHFFELRT